MICEIDQHIFNKVIDVASEWEELAGIDKDVRLSALDNNTVISVLLQDVLSKYEKRLAEKK